MIIDHLGMAVSNSEQAKSFFIRALAPLGISVIMEVPGWTGMGKDGKPEFWFGQGSPAQSPMHIAFLADTREQVDQFYATALEAGGTDNGAPGIRAQYHPDYYGAFVYGPDGHNIEAVCHKPST